MSPAPRPIRFELAEGRVAALDFGDPDRPIDVIFLHATGFNARTYADGLSRAPPSASASWRWTSAVMA